MVFVPFGCRSGGVLTMACMVCALEPRQIRCESRQKGERGQRAQRTCPPAHQPVPKHTLPLLRKRSTRYLTEQPLTDP